MLYGNHHCYHSLNMQVTCDGQGLIMSIPTKFPGSVYDSQVFQASTVNQLLVSWPERKGWLLEKMWWGGHQEYQGAHTSCMPVVRWCVAPAIGDWGYPLLLYLLTLCSENTPGPIAWYNQVHWFTCTWIVMESAWTAEVVLPVSPSDWQVPNNGYQEGHPGGSHVHQAPLCGSAVQHSTSAQGSFAGGGGAGYRVVGQGRGLVTWWGVRAVGPPFTTPHSLFTCTSHLVCPRCFPLHTRHLLALLLSMECHWDYLASRANDQLPCLTSPAQMCSLHLSATMSLQCLPAFPPPSPPFVCKVVQVVAVPLPPLEQGL